MRCRTYQTFESTALRTTHCCHESGSCVRISLPMTLPMSPWLKCWTLQCSLATRGLALLSATPRASKCSDKPFSVARTSISPELSQTSPTLLHRTAHHHFYLHRSSACARPVRAENRRDRPAFRRHHLCRRKRLLCRQSKRHGCGCACRHRIRA